MFTAASNNAFLAINHAGGTDADAGNFLDLHTGLTNSVIDDHDDALDHIVLLLHLARLLFCGADQAPGFKIDYAPPRSWCHRSQHLPQIFPWHRVPPRALYFELFAVLFPVRLKDIHLRPKTGANFRKRANRPYIRLNSTLNLCLNLLESSLQVTS